MLLNDTLLVASPFTTTYEGEVDPPVADPPAADPTPAEKKPTEKVKLNTEQQAFVNSLLAEERRKSTAKNDQLITQLETEKNRSGTTAAEKAQLEERIETLKNEFATKDELRSRAARPPRSSRNSRQEEQAARGRGLDLEDPLRP